LLEEYERIISKDEDRLRISISPSKSVWLVYNHLKKFPVASVTAIEKEVDLSFNSISKALYILQEAQIIQQEGQGARNRIWKYTELEHLLTTYPFV